MTSIGQKIDKKYRTPTLQYKPSIDAIPASYCCFHLIQLNWMRKYIDIEIKSTLINLKSSIIIFQLKKMLINIIIAVSKVQEAQVPTRNVVAAPYLRGSFIFLYAI